MVKDMTKGSPLRLLILFAFPMFLSSCLQQVYSVTDTIIVGRGVGTAALAAVGATGSLTWMIIGFIQGLTHGFSIVISQHFGAGDEGETKKAVTMSLILAGIFSAVVSVLGAVFSPQLLTLMGTPADILEDSVLYLRIILGGTVATIFSNITGAVLRAFGNSSAPLFVMMISSLVNIGLDLLFVLSFGWGIAGAAIATLIAQALSGFLCLFFMSRIDMLKTKAEDWKWENRAIKELLKMGLPAGIMNSITAIGMVVLQSSVNALGSLTVAAYTLGSKIIGLADQATCVIGMALATYCGQNYGAGNIKRTRQGVRAGTVLAVAFSLIETAILIFFGKAISSVFLESGQEAVVDAAYPYLLICGAGLFVLGMLFVFRYSLQGIGDTVVPMFSGILELLARVGIVFLLPASMGFYRICYAEVGAWIAATLLLGADYFYRIAQLTKRKV